MTTPRPDWASMSAEEIWRELYRRWNPERGWFGDEFLREFPTILTAVRRDAATKTVRAIVIAGLDGEKGFTTERWIDSQWPEPKEDV
jgi:hypothetical protein